MKKVIKHPKKMKNAMYVVFGVFALALFGITRSNPSYASDWLILDDALDIITVWNVIENSSPENNEWENKIKGENQEQKENQDSEDLVDDELEDKWEEYQKIDKENIEDNNIESEKILNWEDINSDGRNEDWNNTVVKSPNKTIKAFEVWQLVTTSDWCYTWKTLWEWKIEIVKFNKSCKTNNLVIPDEINWYVVTKIWTWVFEYYFEYDEKIESITIPNSVEVIGERSFYYVNYPNSISINLPTNLKFIGKEAFMHSALTWNFVFPEWLEYIWERSFMWIHDNWVFSNLIIPDSVIYIGEYAFNSSPVYNLHIWSWLKEIWNYAFQSCKIWELYIPDNVEKIWSRAFESNTLMTRVEIGSWNGYLEIWDSVFWWTSITDFSINKDTLYLKNNTSWSATSYWSYYTNVNITLNNYLRDKDTDGILGSTSNCVSNGNNSFVCTDPLKADLVLSWNAFSWELSWASWGDLYVKSFKYPETVTKLSNNFLYWRYYWTGLIVPWSVKEITNNAFNQSKIQYLVLGEWVEIVWTWAFSSNYSLTGIVFPSTLKEIWYRAFRYSNNLLDLDIPWNVKIIWAEAFENSNKLKNIKFSEWLEEIWTWSFLNLNNEIDAINLPDSIKFIWDYAFCNTIYNPETKQNDIVFRQITWYITNDLSQDIIDNSYNTCINYIRKYKIDFTWNSNLITYPERQIVNLNEVTINPNTPKIEWYTFWWYKQWEDVPYDFSTPVTENIILEAKLSKNSYRVIYQDDNWTIIEEKIVEFEDSIPQISPTKECNVFSWWDTELPETMPAHDITLKAIWNYTCSRSSWGGWWVKKSESATREIAVDTSTDQEHNSANEEQKTETSSNLEKIKNQEIGQEIAIDWWTQKTVVVKNTEIVATVRNTTHSSSSRFTKEENDAYSFAKWNGITTTDSIDNAKMNTELTRIQMAKMLSNYAVNVLWQEPDVSKWIVKFDDVTNKMDDQYDNAVTKAYQLWIMWQNMKNNEFRPNDEVTRAEFASALSRLLYKTEEWNYKWTWKYYIPHVAKLYNEWIINKTDPKIKEKRWYVMTMLMRTVQ